MTLPQEIQLERSLLRPWRQSDRAALLRHANDRDVWRNLRDRFPHPYTDAAADAWLSFVAAHEPPPGIWAIEYETPRGAEVIGTIALEPGPDIETWVWEVGYWIGKEFWGHGIVSEALRAVTTAAFAEPEVVRIHAPVFSWNPASMRVLEKAGFHREAVLERGGIKDGTVIDRVIYAITRDTGRPYVPYRSSTR